ncbi:MAG: aminodeoxychorismate/anthranilate synthase component II [Propionibacteriaceae bacterium]|jgi:anthranilate synthase component 2|nr:aminodeoxychorismate/anthranilate synthase component II [Propionibacteriaceae bacterium]
MILLIDNYDSFSYNLYQLLGTIAEDMWSKADIKVIRNDELSVADISALAPTHLVISPGPGRPSTAGVIEEAVSVLSPSVPILGVCLGHQAICEAFGAQIVHAKELMHGKPDEVSINPHSPLFAGLPAQVTCARYHSLAADPASIPSKLAVIATAKDGEVMAVQHTRFPTYGIQFHPESILTPLGHVIIKNFLAL